MYKAPVLPIKAEFKACVNCVHWNKKKRNKTGSCPWGDRLSDMGYLNDDGTILKEPTRWPDGKVKWRKWDFLCWNWSDHGEINEWMFKNTVQE